MIKYSEVTVFPPSTRTVWGSANSAFPFITVTPAPFSRARTPPTSWPVTAFFRFCSASMSTKASPEPPMEKDGARRNCSSSSAVLTITLVGMHPTFRQVPPSWPFSTRQVFFPARPASTAAA